jgi:hypothetical protein
MTKSKPQTTQPPKVPSKVLSQDKFNLDSKARSLLAQFLEPAAKPK